MRDRGFERFAPLAGVVVLLLAIVSFVLSSSSPDADASAAKVVKYWHDHDSRETAAALIAALASLFLVWFVASLRSVILRAEGAGGRLATLAFAGGVIGAIGLLMNAAFEFTVADTVGDVPPEVTQTLSTLYADFFLPLIAGFVLLNVATGLAALRYRILPAWAGIVMLVLAVVGITPIGWIALLVSIVWIAVVGVMMMEPIASTFPFSIWFGK
jgi:hypothetical protein